jgi:carboxymethylenebutenolidase
MLNRKQHPETTMGKTLSLKASDGHDFSAYRADPNGAPKGGIVLLQEIFGVNSHIRSVADRWAEEGYVVIAPALFDRAERNFEVGYAGPDLERGKAVRGKVSNDEALRDIAASADALRKEGLKLAVVGYCWGGSLAWAAATKLTGFSAAVSYYGGEVATTADAKPNCPVMFHFGEKDGSIPLDKVEIVKAKQPDAPLFVYAGAGHGFSCDARGSYHAESAALAFQRSKDFLAKNM